LVKPIPEIDMYGAWTLARTAATAWAALGQQPQAQVSPSQHSSQQHAVWQRAFALSVMVFTSSRF
jgi:hypothetical protein